MKRWNLAAVSAGAATLLALSPLLAPQAVLASTNTLQVQPSQTQGSGSTSPSVGQPTSFTVSPTSGTTINPNDTYQVSLSLENSSGSNVSYLPYTNPSIGGQPYGAMATNNNNNQSVTSVVYSVYGSGLSAGIPISLTPLDLGATQAFVQVTDMNSKTVVGSVYEPIDADSTSPTVPDNFMTPTSATIGSPVTSNINVYDMYGGSDTSNTSNDPVSYRVQFVRMVNGTPEAVTSSDVSSVVYGISTPSTSTITMNSIAIDNGIAKITDPQNPNLLQNEVFNLGYTFNTTGDYVVLLSVLDNATNQVLYQTAHSVSVGAPNVTFNLTNSDGATVTGPNVYLTVQTADTQNGASTSGGATAGGQYGGFPWTFSLPSTAGTPSAYLPAGQYVVTNIYDNGSNIPLANPIPFTVSSDTTATAVNVVEPALGQISGTLTDEAGNAIPDASISLYPVNKDGVPNQYASPIFASTDSKGAISTTSLPIGTYEATVAYLQDNSSTNTNTYAGLVGIGTTFSVTKGSNTPLTLKTVPLFLDQPFTTIANESDWHSVDVSPALLSSVANKKVYFKVSVTENSQPVTSGVSLQLYTGQGNPLSFNIGSDGTATVGKNAPMAGSNIQYSGLVTDFESSGLYSIKYSIIDASTGDAIATTTQNIDVQAPNVTGEIVAPDGTTPVGFESVSLVSDSGQSTELWANQNGQFQGLLPAGNWTVTSIDKWSPATAKQQTVDVSSQNITFTIPTSGGTVNNVKVEDTSINLIGTAYEDPAGKTPLANGYVSLEQTGSNTWYGLNTDSTGQFAAEMPAGTYQVMSLGDMNTNVQISGVTITVGNTGVTTQNIAPPQPDFDFQVEDQNGNAVTSGYVGIVPTPASGQTLDYSNATWFSIQPNGTVAGNLPDGNYTAFSVSEPNTGFPVQVNFTIKNGQPTKQVTIAPPQATLTGTLVDASGNPVKWAGIAVVPTGSSSNTQPIWLTTDQNGNFTDVGWDNNGNYTVLLTPGTAYTVVGVSTQTNYVTLNQSMGTFTAGDKWQLQLPGADLTGSISINGNTIQNGGVSLIPTTANGDASQSVWVNITGGQFSASLPAGEYTVYGVYDASSQQYYDESQRTNQTPITISNVGTLEHVGTITLDNNFVGKVDGAPNGGLWVSTTDPTSANFNWSSAQWISLDQNGNFSTYLTPGSWYVVGVSSQTGYTPLDEPITVNATAGTPFDVNVTPNVSGTVSNLPAGLSQAEGDDAWVVLQDTTNLANTYSAPINLATGQYQTYLPQGTYQVIGISTYNNTSSNSNWFDLTGQSGTTITVPATGNVTENISIPTPSQGSVEDANGSVFTGAQYIELQSTSNSNTFTSIPVDANGNYSTTLSANAWQVVGVETTNAYYSASGTIGQTITVGSALS